MGRYQRDHNPAGWGFGVTIGVVLAVLLVAGLLILICGGGCVAILTGMGAAIGEANRNAPPKEIHDTAPSPVVAEEKPKPPRLELLGRDESGEVPIFKVRIWTELPTDEHIATALDRMRVETNRIIYIYTIDQDAAEQPFAEYRVNVNDTQKIR